MSRPETNGYFPFLLFLPVLLFGLSACGSAQVLDISREEAAEFLRKGDTGFILRADLPANFSRAKSRLNELVLVHPAAPFYAGLLIEASKDAEEEGARENNDGEKSGHPHTRKDIEKLLYCAALESPSPQAARAAAKKLVPLILNSRDDREVKNIHKIARSRGLKRLDAALTLRAACLYRLGRYKDAVKLLSRADASAFEKDAPLSEWNRAILLLSEWKNLSGEPESAERLKREISGFLFGALPPEILRWAYAEPLLLEGLLDSGELAALAGRLTPEDYRTSLSNFREAFQDGGLVFFRRPGLIAELGKAYQYTSAREEGAALFKAWVSLVENPCAPFELPPSLAGGAENDGSAELKQFLKSLDEENRNSVKYTLLFYTGRILRSLEDYASSNQYFGLALAIAPDALQSDACAWYMLMNTLAGEPARAAASALEAMSGWNDLSYFTDVLERISAYLASNRQWNSILEIFARMESFFRPDSGGGASALAQYAWILGRAAQEGYIKTERGAEDFFRIAFGEGGPVYYRVMAASGLGTSFTLPNDVSENQDRPDTAPLGTTEGEAGFILGLLEYGLLSFAVPYILDAETELSVPELREIAEALALKGDTRGSINIAARYTARKDYRQSRRDLYLLYPRPFGELVEKIAAENGIGPEVLYGIIRTESYFMPGAVSRSGAVGLCQLMLPTAEDMADRIARRGGPDYRGNINLKDPEINIRLGAFYLQYLIEHTRSPMLGFLSYNGGMGRVRRWRVAQDEAAEGRLPDDLFLETIEYPETRDYGRKVLAAASVYGYLYYGMSMEAQAISAGN